MHLIWQCKNEMGSSVACFYLWDDLPLPFPFPLPFGDKAGSEGRSSSELLRSGDLCLAWSLSELLRIENLCFLCCILGLRHGAGTASSSESVSSGHCTGEACGASSLDSTCTGWEVEGLAGAGAAAVAHFGPPLYLLPDKQHLKWVNPTLSSVAVPCCVPVLVNFLRNR